MKDSAIENELLENLKNLNVEQKNDVLSYIKTLSGIGDQKDNRRRNAIRQIRSALKGTLLF